MINWIIIKIVQKISVIGIMYKKNNNFINVICKDELKKIEEDINKLKNKKIHLLEDKNKIIEILKEHYNGKNNETDMILDEIMKLIK